MTASCFVEMLTRYLEKFQATAQQLTEARQLGRPSQEAEAALLQDLTAYTWAVRSRTLLLPATPPAERDEALELHTRLSVVETLVGLRYGQPLPQPVETPIETVPTQALRQRLASVESRLFHLYGVVPLN